MSETIIITTERDTEGNHSYTFTISSAHECQGFATREAALEAARAHARLVSRNKPVEIVFGLGAVYAGPDHF